MAYRLTILSGIMVQLLVLASCQDVLNSTDKKSSKTETIELNQEYCFKLNQDLKEITMIFIPKTTGYYHFIDKEATYYPSFSPKFSVFSESSLLGSNSDNDIAILPNTYLLEGKEYTIKCSGNNTTTEVNCCIKVEFDFDDNRSLCDGYGGKRSFIRSLVGKIDYKNDVDIYDVFSDEDSYVHITVTDVNEPSDFNPDVTIKDENNITLTSDRQSDIATLSNVKLLANKLYKVYVKCYNGSKLSSYKIEFEKDKDDFEKLENDENYKGTIDKKNDSDRFFFELNNGEGYYHIVAEEYGNPSDLDPSIELRDMETNRQLGLDNDANQAVLVNLSLVSNHRYQITVNDLGNDKTGSYWVKFVRDLDDDNGIASFQPTINCKIDYKGDIDRISYSPVTTSDIITFNAIEPGFTFRIGVYDMNKKQISYRISNSATYTLKISELKLIPGNKYYFEVGCNNFNNIISKYSINLAY